MLQCTKPFFDPTDRFAIHPKTFYRVMNVSSFLPKNFRVFLHASRFRSGAVLQSGKFSEPVHHVFAETDLQEHRACLGRRRIDRQMWTPLTGSLNNG